MSILIQGCSLINLIPKGFPAALAVSYAWLSKNREKIPQVLKDNYKIFFDKYRGHKQLKRQEKL